MIVAPKSCKVCPLTELLHPKDMIRMGFNLLDEAQRLFSMAVGATTSKEADIHYIINMVDEFNLRITRLREENSTGFHKISGFDRILDELEE